MGAGDRIQVFIYVISYQNLYSTYVVAVLVESLLGLARGMCQLEMSQLTVCVVLVQVMLVRHQKRHQINQSVN